MNTVILIQYTFKQHNTVVVVHVSLNWDPDVIPKGCPYGGYLSVEVCSYIWIIRIVYIPLVLQSANNISNIKYMENYQVTQTSTDFVSIFFYFQMSEYIFYFVYKKRIFTNRTSYSFAVFNIDSRRYDAKLLFGE